MCKVTKRDVPVDPVRSFLRFRGSPKGRPYLYNNRKGLFITWKFTDFPQGAVWKRIMFIAAMIKNHLT